MRDKRILVTGGTGSFGKAFVSRADRPRRRSSRVVIFSRDELKQYEMAAVASADKARAHALLHRRRARPARGSRWRCATSTIVIHAAALKQVPAAEYNPFECIHTNVLGAENVVRAALRNRVKQVVALSTDKACQPDQPLRRDQARLRQDLRRGQQSRRLDLGTRFSVVRYGNVVGSRGSVVPLFRKLIAEGADSLPITDARMTRFWITLRQGVDFVLSSLEMMHGGEIFVPKIPTMKITDLARDHGAAAASTRSSASGPARSCTR